MGSFIAVTDELPRLHQVRLETSPHLSTHYSPFLMPMLGEHAVNYMFMHYFTATSTVLVANTYSRFSNDAGEFVRHLTAMGLAPRNAAYLWTVISPEIMGPPRRSSPPVARQPGPSRVHTMEVL